MTRPLSDIPKGELPALVEQGLPISEYAGEVQRRRAPDCVFNCFSDGFVWQSHYCAHHTAQSWKEHNDARPEDPRITHRIRVFLKGQT